MEYIAPNMEEMGIFSCDIVCLSGGLDAFTLGELMDGDIIYI